MATVMVTFEEPCVGELIESVTKEFSDKFNVEFCSEGRTKCSNN